MFVRLSERRDKLKEFNDRRPVYIIIIIIKP